MDAELFAQYLQDAKNLKTLEEFITFLHRRLTKGNAFWYTDKVNQYEYAAHYEMKKVFYILNKENSILPEKFKGVDKTTFDKLVKVFATVSGETLIVSFPLPKLLEVYKFLTGLDYNRNPEDGLELIRFLKEIVTAVWPPIRGGVSSNIVDESKPRMNMFENVKLGVNEQKMRKNYLKQMIENLQEWLEEDLSEQDKESVSNVIHIAGRKIEAMQ